MIPLDIISDPICPWCYIGKARLERALESAGRQPFDIHWRPFQLNPDMPREGMDRRAYLDAKFGADRARDFYATIAKAADDAGLNVDFDAIERTPNTIDAHRLIQWSRVEGRQNAMVSELFRRYFERGEDIGARDVLVDAARAAGLDGEMMGRLLDGDADIAEIRAADAHYREIGISGVPCFVVAGRYVVSGAQPPELWTQVIEELSEAGQLR